jgi:predicted membrane-bound spermidine synthase
MKDLLKRIASFAWDIPIEKTSSQYNPYLEVVWSNGKKMLNTKDANFSFGNGYRVFEKAFNLIKKHVPASKKTLILGFGCGSILHLLEKKYNYEGEIVGVEYDQVILDLFDKHFAKDYSTKPKLITGDAMNFVKESNETYDLIFVDLFTELDNVGFIFSQDFLSQLNNICEQGGVIVFNTIKRTSEDQKNLSGLIMDLSRNFKDVSSNSFQDLNQIIIAI